MSKFSKDAPGTAMRVRSLYEPASADPATTSMHTASVEGIQPRDRLMMDLLRARDGARRGAWLPDGAGDPRRTARYHTALTRRGTNRTAAGIPPGVGASGPRPAWWSWGAGLTCRVSVSGSCAARSIGVAAIAARRSVRRPFRTRSRAIHWGSGRLAVAGSVTPTTFLGRQAVPRTAAATHFSAAADPWSENGPQRGHPGPRTGRGVGAADAWASASRGEPRLRVSNTP